MVSAFAVVMDPPRPVRRANGVRPPAVPPTGGGDGDDRDREPRRPGLENARLATMFFIAAEIMFFAGLISSYLVLRTGAAQWPPPLQPRLPILVTGLNTIVLLGSSVAMFRALRARADHGRLTRGLALTGALGVVFLLVQGYEWVRLVSYGLTMTSGAYGVTFYTLIGVHGLHVLGALVWLGIMVAGVRRGRFADAPAAGLRACGMYWHFVVALWPVLYVAVYLL
jgi:heme/copper-type cytochrome/quinol oxidase subunit 3